MNLDRIVRECGLSGGVVETLLKTEVKEENIDFLTDAYDKGDEVFGEAIATVAKLENITAEELNLYIYILLYVRIYSLYREREIPDK